MNQLPLNFQSKCFKQKKYCTKHWYFLVLYCPTLIFAPACCLHHTFPETAEEVGLQQSPVCVIAKFTRVMSLASPLQKHCQGWLAFLRGRWRTLSKPPMKIPILFLSNKIFFLHCFFFILGINLLLTKTFKRMSCDHRDSLVRILRQMLGCLVRISLYKDIYYLLGTRAYQECHLGPVSERRSPFPTRNKFCPGATFPTTVWAVSCPLNPGPGAPCQNTHLRDGHYTDRKQSSKY